MTYFENLKELFEFLKNFNAPKKALNKFKWVGMAKTMHNVVLKQMKVILQ